MVKWLLLGVVGCAVPVPTEVAYWGGNEVPLTYVMWEDMDAARRCAGVPRSVPRHLRIWVLPDSALLVMQGYDVAGFSRGPHIVLKADYMRPRYLRHEGVHAALRGDVYHQHPGWASGATCGFPPI